MTLSKVNHIVTRAMTILETVDCVSVHKSKRELAQKKVNQAYELLDRFKDEIIREKINANQKRKDNDGKNL